MFHLWWNWKAAAASAILRGGIFFSVSLVAGWAAALTALAVEFCYRAIVPGFCGAIIQTLCDIQLQRMSRIIVLCVLALATHCIEFSIHTASGTPKAWLGVAVSFGMTVMSNAFNFFVMKRGVFRVGSGQPSLAADLRRMPGLMREFLSYGIRYS
jgi:hypothetical protein